MGATRCSRPWRINPLHELAVSDNVTKGGVLDHDDQLRDQRRNNVAKGLRKDDEEENLGFGRTHDKRMPSPLVIL